jgi:ABC-type bacteriocin/lantibiotic exporter with double-glycine peptidase domain
MQNENPKSNLPFYRQETPDSCVPACLRMVLAGLGVVTPEVELRQMCDCTILGTDAFQAVEALRQLGFPDATKQNLTLTDLSTVLAQGNYPIVYVNLLPLEQECGTHALVVTQIEDALVTVYDPMIGRRSLERIAFEQAWQLTKGLTILVSSLI